LNEPRRWYSIGTASHHGYPQPEEDFEYLKTYGDSICRRCGIHGPAREAWRFRNEPILKRSAFMQQNWVFDVLFARTEVIATLEREGITGFRAIPAVRHKTGHRLADWAELRLDHVVSGVVTDGLQCVTCQVRNEEIGYESPATPCGRIKHHHPKIVRMRSGSFEEAPDLARSAEWFGSGGSASQLLIASERLIDLIERSRWRGLWAREIVLT
jgi:hypothetical protein